MKKKRRSILGNPQVQGVLVLTSVIVFASLFIFNNRQPAETISAPVRAATTTSEVDTQWQSRLQDELAAIPTATLTPLPTVEVGASPFIPPTLPVANSDIEGFSPAGLSPVTALPLPSGAIISTSEPPIFVNATQIPLPASAGLDIASAPLENPQGFQVPPEEIPLSRQPNDHFWLTRPINVQGNSRYLFSYPYGSGLQQGWRIHRGLDMPNPSGTEVRAAGSGTVCFAGKNETGDREVDPNCDNMEIFNSYGNFVVIEHDFGWRGEPIWTLYAHLSAILIEEGQRVEMGDPIGLVGVTGQVTGPHVHFEVRVANNNYFSTRNPMLWMAPYLNHGVVAGQVLDGSGNFIDNALIQLNRNGRLVDSTTSYLNPWQAGRRSWAVVPTESWNENFVLGDIPAGDYDMVILVEGQRFFQSVSVQTGTTTFIELQLDVAATPQPYIEPTLDEFGSEPGFQPTALPSATP